MTGSTGLLRIGELGRRTGVSPELLRAWEQRYGLLQPTRSPGGFRLYSVLDEARVRRMNELLADGLSAAEAAREALLVEGQGAALRSADVAALAVQLRQALDAFDAEQTHAALDRLLNGVPVESALADILLPYLRELGGRWASGEATVAQEHFASTLLRGRLLALSRGWDRGDGPRILLACLPGELHDLGLLAFGLLVANRGWRVTFLGADTPLDTVAEAASRLHPEQIVLVGLAGQLLRKNASGVRALAQRWPVAVAGGADPAKVTATGARPLLRDLVGAARSLAP
ncbi:MAG: MerR family transcriptional regulator [Mycobacteriales bacterium]